MDNLIEIEMVADGLADHNPADYYAGENNNRKHDGKDRALIVNTMSSD